ncbi:MAG TPA: hypothetical protein VJS65_04390 [Verrucomicrobiae bacterium]|nr:hypothetical protein [Verrucomicrobiae bacterium]
MRILVKGAAFLAILAPWWANAAYKVAVVPKDPSLREAADLLGVTLSADKRIVLLEREQVERIQREQELTTTASGDVQLGQILGADGLLMLERTVEGDKSGLSTRLIAVKPGVILRTTVYSWPLTNLAEWPPGVLSQLDPLLPKLGVLARDATPISVVNLRSATKSDTAERLERELTLLMINRLSRQPDVFVLERQRLDLLSEEKELKKVDPSPFWNGSYLLEGVVDRDGFSPANLTLHVRLAGPAGKAPIDIESSGPRRDPTVAVDALVREILNRLGKDSKAVAWDARAEAARYVEEGEWAMKWQVYEQARWAGESAWALGNRSVRAGRIRVLAYCSPWNVPPGHVILNEYTLKFDYQQVYPDALEPVAIALENFVSATPWLDRDANANEWSQVGVTTLGYAAHHLSRYWWTESEVPGVADKLARLRSSARLAERLLLSGVDRPTPQTYVTAIGTSIWQLKLILGWLWVERPSDVLDEYRRLLDGGLSETQRHQFLFREVRRPAVPAWTAADRAAAPRLWNEFLDQRIASTNATVSLLAHLLRLQFTPADFLVDEPEGSYTRAVRPVFDALARHGSELMCSSPELFRDALTVVQRRKKTNWEPPAGVPLTNAARDFRTNFVHQWAGRGRCFDAAVAPAVFRTSDFEAAHLRLVLEMMRSRTGTGEGKIPRWKQNFFRAYLASYREPEGSTGSMLLKGLYRPEVFAALFDPEDYGLEDGAELLRAMNTFRNNMEVPGDPMARPIAALEARLASLRPARVPAAGPARTPGPTQGTLEVSRWWQAPNPLPEPRLMTELRLLEGRYREGFLWLEARVGFLTNQILSLPRDSRSVIFKVDLKTLTSRHSIFSPAVPAMGEPRYWTMLPRTFEVLGGRVYVSWRAQLLAAPIELNEWKPVDAPVAGQSRLFGVGSRLYVGATDRLLEYDPVSRETRVMASSRRRPVETELDSHPKLGDASFIRGDVAGNVVHVIIGGVVYPWRVDSRSWGSPISVAAGRGGLGVVASVEDSALLGNSAMSWDAQKLFRFTPTQAAELILEVARKSPGFPMPRPPTGANVPPAAPARWTSPGHLDPLTLPMTLEPARVLMLNRQSLTGPQQRPSLVVFDDRSREPIELRLQFNRANPFPVDETQMMGARPQLVATPEGLVLTGRLWKGLWFIPREDLEAALAQARAGSVR